jgi:hypothetical protein
MFHLLYLKLIFNFIYKKADISFDIPKNLMFHLLYLKLIFHFIPETYFMYVPKTTDISIVIPENYISFDIRETITASVV